MEVQIESEKHTEVIDVTEQVRRNIPGSHDGLCLVFVPHTTAAVTVNEGEERLMTDIGDLVDTVVEADRRYRHNVVDDNAASHLRQTLIGSSVVVPVDDGEFILGTWQSILFVELDGPRKRRIELKFL